MVLVAPPEEEGLDNEVSYCTDGLGSGYLRGNYHSKFHPWLVGFWLVLDFLSHFTSLGSSGARVRYSSIPKSKGLANQKWKCIHKQSSVD